jgi:hypothetical protein
VRVSEFFQTSELSSAKASEVSGVTITSKMQIPVMTTYPDSAPDKPGGLFGQLSVVTIEIASEENIYPEDLVELVDEIRKDLASNPDISWYSVNSAN